MTEVIASLSKTIEPATKKFLDALNGSGAKPLYQLPVEEARKVLKSAQEVDVKKMPADIKDEILPVGPSGKVSIRIFRPKGATGMLPAMVYFHGGGWVLGDMETHDRLARELAAGANAAIVFVNFTPAPEAKYPTQIEEAYAATKYIAERGRDFDINPSQLVIGGDSVGGNMAIAVTLLAKDRGGPNIVQQVLFYPVTDTNFDDGSYREFGTDHFLTREAMKWFWHHYADQKVWREPTATPLNASLSQLKGLPPALIFTAEHDVLRDEGEAFAHKLQEAGVPVRAMRMLGTIHDFVLLNAITETPAPRAAIMITCATLRSLWNR